ncbi:hypothetical protein ABZZ47_30390 [Streptomyces sp. NPDC006465]|uniref:hypothetical protein n=1 Tax=Streptomyces sp. NPDC006465 TaxID=3157174 RepID=UPI0033A66C3A
MRRGKALQDEGRIPKGAFMPGIDPINAQQGKSLRAEPIAQQMVEDRARPRGAFVDLENAWATWQPSDQDSRAVSTPRASSCTA